MTILPAIENYISPAPTISGTSYTKKQQRFIPDEPDSNFWNHFYTMMYVSGNFSTPLENMKDAINPYFGFFGMRWHPEHMKPQSFHSGLDIEGTSKTHVRAIAPGILEYSGYGLINGKYIMLSHNHITTEDGYTLHSLYIHLSHTNIKFTSYQKMLREISLHTYPHIHVDQDNVLGGVGKTGASSYPEKYTHVHIQLELRNSKGDIVFLDPLRVLLGEEKENITADITTHDAFKNILKKYTDDIKVRGLESIWEKEQ